ncbi:MAG: glycoside hydrolase family 5 protein [Ktedonobacterales bacterium]
MQRSLLLSVSASLVLCITVVLGLDLLRPSTARADLFRPDLLRSSTADAGLPGLSVRGNQLLAGGVPITLHGVNRSGTEYACIQGWGIEDGPMDQSSENAIAAWGANLVRIPLNEDCWLGINGVNPAYGGSNYISAIRTLVDQVNAAGMYTELSLMWAAPGSIQATYQPGAPDEDHSPAMWASLASTFAGDPDVILAPWGEPTVDANCLLNGGTCEVPYDANYIPTTYDTAGMQQAVTVMRQAGYNGVISIPGINYANDLTQWLSYEPSDPDHQLVAEAHIYGNNSCGAENNGSCLVSTLDPVAAKVPLLLGETGETYDDSTCTGNNEQVILDWADSEHVSWAAWTWNTWGDCSSLIQDFSGTVQSGDAYAAVVQTHMLADSAAATPAPTTTSALPTATPVSPTPTTVPPKSTSAAIRPPASLTFVQDRSRVFDSALLLVVALACTALGLFLILRNRH